MERLRSIGLKDEIYSPILNREEDYNYRKNYYRIHLGLNFKIIDGLNFDIKYQTENSSSKERNLYSKNSYFVRNMINDAAQYDEATKTLKLNVPDGGQLSELRGDFYSYTLRSQFNYMKEKKKNLITGLAGAERRLVKSTSTLVHYMGYDDISLDLNLSTL